MCKESGQSDQAAIGARAAVGQSVQVPVMHYDSGSACDIGNANEEDDIPYRRRSSRPQKPTNRAVESRFAKQEAD
ncbi:hypothetical protein GN958_ATG10192 [Phytophthora infestans]|uniref:Uncharacterized protein n=1 Tax=Phytophthora infestans TaxID=4787 RepID=A0A8S9UME4_PHYIN|nr:hypothetical protein GN958_ATG10192 [Phytophthora infestans]